MTRTAAALCVVLLLGQPTLVQRSTRAPGVPDVVLAAERRWAGAEILLPLTVSDDERVKPYAIRALGRLEDVRLVPHLLALLPSAITTPSAAAPAADAIAQALHGFDPREDPDLIARVAERFRRLADNGELMLVSAVEPLGRVPYLESEDVARAERILTRIVDRTTADARFRDLRESAVRSLESLARLNSTLVAFEPATIRALSSAVARTHANDSAPVRLYALMALLASRSLDRDTLARALNDDDEQVRRIAMSAIAGSAVVIGDGEREDAVARGMIDRSVLVRYEAVRAFVRRVVPRKGCGSLLDALADRSLHVVVAAIDALGDACKDDNGVTNRLIAETRTPPPSGSWQREAHAFVALAKRAPEAAAIAMTAFRAHPVWQVRMYAARAAAALGDTASLERLALDAHDNVREATLGALQRLRSTGAHPALTAALGRTDYQLLRTAASALKSVPPDHDLFRPLADALSRVTRERKETSRDTRLALLEAVAVHGGPEDASGLAPLLKDFDPRIAARAAELLTAWTGRPLAPDPQPPARGRAAEPIDPQQCLQIALKNGRTFRIQLDGLAAPITAAHFVKLATVDHYYDGLTFHRIVPNFIVQGGSPGANEYAGQGEFMRDEIARRNERGTIGLSVRGRNTGDAQFYINLVDNPRLDYDYTIFGSVAPPDMPVLDEIQEGDEISRVVTSGCPPSKRRLQ